MMSAVMMVDSRVEGLLLPLPRLLEFSSTGLHTAPRAMPDVTLFFGAFRGETLYLPDECT
jgi:hypothetical protein